MKIMDSSSLQTRELMSALADGQLQGEAFATALEACGEDESALSAWNTYHLIGDALRQPVVDGVAGAARGADRAFVARVSAQLAQAPIAALPAKTFDRVVKAEAIPSEPIHHRGPASNDGIFRWKLVAGFASLAAVSLIAWNALGLMTPAAAPLLAGGQAPTQAQQVVVTSPEGLMIRDARLEELLAAHKQIGGTSALQEPSGFLRNATFETSQSSGR